MTSNTTLYTLPNGMAIHHHRAYETDFVYREVFVEEIYTRSFGQLPTNATVVDVGANIGLFSLLIKQQLPDARVYAFEPAPVHFALLGKNLAAYRAVQLFQQGLGEAVTHKRFTYYPNYSVMSGFHADAHDDRQLLAAGIASQLQLDQPEKVEAAERYIEILMDNKLDDAQQFDCSITTLSAFIDEQKITHIDLLKIDAEKAESDVLGGIADKDWGKISRIVLEAHDKTSCDHICTLLAGRGYSVRQNKSSEFRETAIFMIYATQQRI
jgi:FkbM family methyltransferase